jgi:hypothetical protein
MADTASEIEKLSGLISSNTTAAVKTLSETAERFVNFAPLERVTYFGFALTVTAVGTEFANAAVPRFEFRPDIIIWMLASGIFVIFSGALAEGILRVVLARSALTQAKELERQADELRQDVKKGLSSIFRKTSAIEKQ